MSIDNPPPSDPARDQGSRKGLVPGTLEGEPAKAERLDPDEDRTTLNAGKSSQPGDMEHFQQIRPADVDPADNDGVPDLTEAGPAELAAVEGLEPGEFPPEGDRDVLQIANRPEDAPGSTVGTEADDEPRRGEGDGHTNLPETSPKEPERFEGAVEEAEAERPEGLTPEQDRVDNATDDDGVTSVESAEAVHDDKHEG